MSHTRGDRAETQILLAEALIDLSRPGEARRLLAQAMEILAPLEEPTAVRARETARALLGKIKKKTG